MTRYSMIFPEIAGSFEENLSDEERVNLLAAQYKNDFEQADVDAVLEIIAENLPAGDVFVPLTDEEKNLRQARTDLMREKFAHYSVQAAKYQKTIPNTKFNQRRLEAILERNADGAKQNAQIVAIVNGDDKEAQHGLFLDILDRAAHIDVEKIMNYSDQEFVDHFEEFFSDTLLTMELENIVKDFKEMKCGITKEELALCDQIVQQTCHVGMHCYNRIDTLCSAYYKSIDVSKMEKFNQKVVEEVLNSEELSTNEDLDDYIHTSFPVANEKSTQVFAQVQDLLLADGEKATKGLFLLAPEPGKKEYSSENGKFNYTRGMDYMKKLQAGETVFARTYEADNQSKKTFNSNPHAFRMNEHGLVYEIPYQEEPGLGVRMLDRIMRFFGSQEGMAKCRAYERHLQEVGRIIAENADKTLTGELQKSRIKIQEARSLSIAKFAETYQKRNEKVLVDVREKIKNAKVLSESSQEILHTVYGPEAGGENALTRKNAYTEKDYKPDFLQAPENEVFNERELDLIYMSGISSPDLYGTYKKSIVGLSNAENMMRCHQHAATDLLVAQRSKVTGYMGVINPGRKVAQKALQDYFNQDKKPLAEILGNTVKCEISNILTKSEPNTVQTCEEMRYCMDVLNIIGKDPELVKNCGLSEEDIVKVRAFDMFCKSYEEMLVAKEKLFQAGLQGAADLTPEEKKEALLNVAAFSVLCATENKSIDEAISSDDFKNGLKGTEKLAVEKAKWIQKLATAQSQGATKFETDRLQLQIDDLDDQLETLNYRSEMVLHNRPVSYLMKLLGSSQNGKENLGMLKNAISNLPSFRQLLQNRSQTMLGEVAEDKLGKMFFSDVMEALHPHQGNEKPEVIEKNKQKEAGNDNPVEEKDSENIENALNS